ncbi:uncharacterized protein DUF3515 [Barrientosiimonas humi]|uniref:Uncharacterized protein DUF3515 n=2 Tax=Barrientosiimonas TaxID=1535207 RepID=A0A542XD56_9MICO|nr:DUF3515 family protein [Barrientosiimonas humi]TQL33770.1 uncharacterized protein DUF3515 [Barrientosiimonas humi]CAG7573758.1 hypothetical protein BH39T_PBIAJDOK_02396 [Barrientosiimonas humi]
MHRRPRLTALAVAAATLALSGCSSAVEVSAAPKASDPLCAKAAQQWPTSVSGEELREVSVDSPTVRAWGDPAIIARCGMTSPGPTTNDCIGVSGVDWVARKLSDGMAFTTYGREPAIEVLVPKDYAPEPLVLGAFTEAAQQIPQGPRRCS